MQSSRWQRSLSPLVVEMMQHRSPQMLLLEMKWAHLRLMELQFLMRAVGGVTEAAVVVARTAGVVFDPEEDPAQVLFMILVPNEAGDQHIEILSGLARRMMDPEFTAGLRTSETKSALVHLLNSGDK
jgi:hypothetical protein